LTAYSISAQEFRLTTTKANLVASKATIEVPALSGNAEAIIIATPVGEAEKANPHPIGAWYYSSVLYEGYVYGLDEGILTCLDVNTGVRKWKGGRYGYGQVILASGHLIVSSDSGELALVKATPQQYSEVARFAAIEGKTWNYPAIAGGKLLVRNGNEMAAYNIAAN